MHRTLRRSVMLALLSLLIASTASAQEYADEQGILDLHTEVVVTVTVAGEGFVGDSVVFVVLTDDEGTETDLGTVQIDDQGRFFGDITIPDDLEPGEYTITATGVTAQGATRILSSTFTVGDIVALEANDATQTSSTTGSSLPDVDGQLSSSTTSMPDNPQQTAATFLPLVLGDVWTWLIEGFSG